MRNSNEHKLDMNQFARLRAELKLQHGVYDEEAHLRWEGVEKLETITPAEELRPIVERSASQVMSGLRAAVARLEESLLPTGANRVTRATQVSREGFVRYSPKN
jgi:hypothetical protein